MAINQKNVRDFDFILVSHHAKEHKASPCTSIYNILLSERRIPIRPAEHFHLGEDSKDLKLLISSKENPCVVFNSFASLTRADSFDALTNALTFDIPIIIYWHETAWNLRDFMSRDVVNFSIIRELINSRNIQHWVPTYQNAQFLMYLFGVPVENIDVVFETIDVGHIIDHAGPHHKNSGKIKIVGAGLPDMRKGVDIFNDISTEIDASFHWFSPRKTSALPDSMKESANFSWRGNVKNFPSALQEFDIFLMTSRDDPSPIVCLEAMALGMPVFAFGTTGYAEILPDQFLCRNPDDMVNKVHEYLANKNEWPNEFFVNIARQHDISKFTSKLRAASPKAVSQLPHCESSHILNEPISLTAKLGTAIREAQIAHRKTINQEETYRNNLRWVARKRREMDAQVSAQLALVSEQFKPEIKRLKERESDLKNAHRQARIEVKRDFRKRIFEKLNEVPQKVVVVGNSPSVLEKENGQFIDNCDIVIRINNFQTVGFEKHIGGKTDFAIFTAASKPNTEINRLPSHRRLLHAANYHTSKEKLQARLMEDNGIGLKISEMTTIPPTLYFYGLATLMDLPRNSWPSTGSVALQLAMDVFSNRKSEIYFTGIDFFKNSGRKIDHYFAHTSLSDGKHNAHLEANYFDRFIYSDEIIKL